MKQENTALPVPAKPEKKKRRKKNSSAYVGFSRRLGIIVGIFAAVCLLFAVVMLAFALRDGYFVYSGSASLSACAEKY